MVATTAYTRRLIDDVLDEVQPILRAVSIHGPKSVGKTATAAQRARSTLNLDIPRERELIVADQAILTELPGPVLIDEWQRLPEVWDYVRRAVDADSPRGHFIVAGSSVPRGAVVHSGAGRIVPMRMRPLSLAERHIDTPSVSLAALLAGNAEIAGQTDVRLPDYVEEITSSGFPGIRTEPSRVRGLTLDAYIENLVHREFPEQGYAVRKPDTLRAWLTAYAAATSSTTTYTKILDAATAGDSAKPSKVTTISYRDALSSLYLLDPIPAWTPTRDHVGRLTQAPKHQLADPGLSARLLGLDSTALLRADQGKVQLHNGTILGSLFESLIGQSVLTYAEIVEARVGHLRTKNGEHEIDLIVQRADGRVLALEVKLTDRVTDSDVKHLQWLKRTIGDDLIGAAVVTTGDHAYRRKDGIGVIPAALLGP